jgi:hypothetical protein
VESTDESLLYQPVTYFIDRQVKSARSPVGQSTYGKNPVYGPNRAQDRSIAELAKDRMNEKLESFAKSPCGRHLLVVASGNLGRKSHPVGACG